MNVMSIIGKLFELVTILDKDKAFALLSDIEAVIFKHTPA